MLEPREALGRVEQHRNTGCVVVSAIVNGGDGVAPGRSEGAQPEVIVMGPDDDELVLELAIAAFEQRDDIAAGAFGRMRVDCTGQVEVLKPRPVRAGRLEADFLEAGGDVITGTAL